MTKPQEQAHIPKDPRDHPLGETPGLPEGDTHPVPDVPPKPIPDGDLKDGDPGKPASTSKEFVSEPAVFQRGSQ